jgi:hypothetical protein
MSMFPTDKIINDLFSIPNWFKNASKIYKKNLTDFLEKVL